MVVCNFKIYYYYYYTKTAGHMNSALYLRANSACIVRLGPLHFSNGSSGNEYQTFLWSREGNH